MLIVEKILGFAKQMSLPVAIVTNGTTIDDAYYDLLNYQDLVNLNAKQLEGKINVHGWYRYFAMFTMILLGPFVEEVAYRVCLFTTLRKKSRILSHLITAFLFGFQHIAVAVLLCGRPQEFLYIFSYMGFSLALTAIYQKTKTPVPGIIAHILIN